MQPIVNGIQEDYGEQVSFVSVNVKDGGDGAALFQSLSLPGHPSIVIYMPDGEEVYRRFGIVDFDDLDNTLLDIIES
jgi:hypothetical protein